MTHVFNVTSNKRSVPVFIAAASMTDAADNLLLAAIRIVPNILHIPEPDHSAKSGQCQCHREYAGRNKGGNGGIDGDQ